MAVQQRSQCINIILTLPVPLVEYSLVKKKNKKDHTYS